MTLNALHLVPGETGGSELYARRLVPALLDADPTLLLHVLAAREGAPSLRAEGWGPRARIVDVPVRARSRPARVAAEQLLVPALLPAIRPDLLHNLFTTAPVVPGVPQVTTVHDLIYRRIPESHAPSLRRGMAVLVPLACRRSRRLIAISRAVRDDLVETLSVPEGRIDVVHHGPGMRDDRVPPDEGVLRARLGLGPGPFVLSVSARRPHKNLPRLFEAWALLPEPRPRLVVPGYPSPHDVDLLRRAASLGLAADLVLLDWVGDTDLEGLYRAATAMVFPSLAEGFGLPVLEAMLRGLPVACSDTTSLPEVAGDAALLFDPTDTRAMAAAVTRLMTDADLRASLAARGRVRAAAFSWEASARGTLACYRRALGHAEPAG